jgi:L-iditol 2-dehydrogenase
MFEPSVAAPGDRVLIVGPGPMGVLAAQVVRALGAEAVVRGLVQDAGRLAIARELGFDAAHDDSPPTDCDVAVDASGSAAGAAACLEAVRRRGRYVQIGIFGRPVSVPLDLLLEKELEVSAGFASTPRAWRRALQLMNLRAVKFEPLVSEVVPLSAWQRVFAELRSGRQMKVVFDPRLAA